MDLNYDKLKLEEAGGSCDIDDPEREAYES